MWYIALTALKLSLLLAISVEYTYQKIKQFSMMDAIIAVVVVTEGYLKLAAVVETLCIMMSYILLQTVMHFATIVLMEGAATALDVGLLYGIAKLSTPMMKFIVVDATIEHAGLGILNHLSVN
jgi:hypothetical protein